MQLRRQDNVTYVSIADTTAAAPVAGGVASTTTVTDGAIALVDAGNVILSSGTYGSLADTDTVRVVQNIAGELVFTAAFTKGSIQSTTVKQYTAAVQQKTAIGYSGTGSTGSLPNPASDTNFWIKVRKNDNDAANRSQPTSLFAGPVTAAGSGGQLALGEALVKSGIQNFKDEPANGYLAFELICDDAGSAIAITAGTDATHYSFVKGSNTVTGTDSNGAPVLGSDEINDASLSVGDYIRPGTGTDDPVYKITAITSGTGTDLAGTPMTLTLDVAYQGESALIAIASNEYVTAANAASAECGVKLTGLAAPFDVDAFRNYYANRFTATFSDTSTLNTHIEGANDGSGTWQQVAMDEYMSMGNQGENEQLAVPPRKRTSSVITDGEYDAIMIDVKEDINGLVSADKADANILVYVQDGSGSPSGDAFAAIFGVDGDLT